ncbi:MAG TPA: BPSS1780 family membrane protein [Methylibium sp.]|uniref:BPSS1780 family membrane protein n=1 Tax=Methylibium sp. TaxID=2067992 RepID=UPI002DB8BB1F|nr:BPSS1780 family membrane protein [Methylibium sp.]HEU4458587.1 BPSS1780 family membrane protein [Methylibium sp.]
MKLKTVRAAQGLMWLRAGLAVFARQPLGFSALFALFGLAIVLLLQVPVVGQFAALALMPWLNLAFLLGTRDALVGRTPRPALLLEPWRNVVLRKRLIHVGIAYALGTLVVVLVAHALDGGRFVAALEALADDQAPPESMADGSLAWAVLLRLALLSLLSLLFWYVPGLVAWGEMPLSKALFASAVACLRSLGALAAFNLGWMAVIVLAVSVMQVLLALIGLGNVVAQAVVPVAMLATTAFYASLYFGFVDSFEFDGQDKAGPQVGS